MKVISTRLQKTIMVSNGQAIMLLYVLIAQTLSLSRIQINLLVIPGKALMPIMYLRVAISTVSLTDNQTKMKANNIIAISTKQGLNLIDINQIIYCSADGSYTKIHVKGNKMISVSKCLKSVEGILPKDQFIRVHHATVVNLFQISRYSKTEGLIMHTGEKLVVSVRKSSQIYKLLKTI